MALTPEQESQVVMQLKQHKHDLYYTNIHLGQRQLRGFSVYPGVYRSDQMITRRLTEFLIEEPQLYRDKRVLDLGCGTGNVGIVMAALGAQFVTLSDICETSVANATENVERFGLRRRCEVVLSDLFANVPGRFDLIVFNHPFFADEPIPDVPVSRAMLDPGDLLCRFLVEGRQHLTEGGSIVMPYLMLAGAINHPAVQARGFGYRVRRLRRFTERMGLQTGPSAIYQIWNQVTQ